LIQLGGGKQLDFNDAAAWGFVATLFALAVLSLRLHSFSSAAGTRFNNVAAGAGRLGETVEQVSENKKLVANTLLTKVDRIALEKKISEAIDLISGKIGRKRKEKAVAAIEAA